MSNRFAALVVLSVAGAMLAGCPKPQPNPPPSGSALVLECTAPYAGKKLEAVCQVRGDKLAEQADTPPLGDPQLLQLGTVIGDPPPHEHPDPRMATGKHCWVQLPSGQWQMYHC